MDNQSKDMHNLIETLGKKDDTSKQQAANKMISQLDDKQKKELSELMSDSDKINSILKSPVAEQIIKKISGNNNGKHK